MLPGAAGAEEQGMFALAYEGSGGQVEDQTAIHFGIESKVEVVERLIGVAKTSLLAAALQQSVRAPRQFVGDQAGNQVDGCHRLGLRLAQAAFQYGGHAAQPELP